MKITFDFSPFDELLKRLDAEKVEWKSDAQFSEREVILRQLKNEGIEIDVKQVETTPEGLFTFHGENIVIYIKDKTIFFDENELPKFHFSECATINGSKKTQRYERYFASSRTTGDFPIDRKEGTQIITQSYPLLVCKHCLNKLKTINSRLHRKYPDVSHFNLETFFKDCNPLIYDKPKKTASDAPQTGYTDDWSEVSRKYKKQCGYRCETCNVDLSKHQHLLDTHHINGDKQDNSDRNLKALCKLCHAEEPQHQHYKISQEYRDIIEKLRGEQSIKPRVVRGLFDL
jgi:hypothetical protein